jgi:aspartate 1-decarboxylase
MMRELLRSIVERATVTAADPLRASLVLDPLIMRAASLLPFEAVQFVNVATGARVRTFVAPASEGSGEVRVPSNGRAGDAISILAFAFLHEGQTLNHRVAVVTLDAENHVTAIAER